MARLRNRIVKADFWVDPELLRWPRDKRTTYQGLWAIAEDSGCLEDDPFGWKLCLWPSPLDADITIEVLEQWRDEFIAAGKLVPYEGDGKRYLFLKNFHQHEHPRNPQRPDLPLPLWVRYETQEVKRKDGRVNLVTSYIVDTESVPTAYRGSTVSPVQSRPVPSSPVPVLLHSSAEADPPAFPMDELVTLYHELCPSMPRLKKVDGTRRDRLQRAHKKLGLDGMRELFAKAGASDFLSGRKKDWRADLDFLIKPEHIPRVIEGSYDNQRQAPNVAQALLLVAKCEEQEAARVPN